MSGTPPATLPGGIGPQGMPNLAVPLVNQDGTVAFAWYQFFVSLFQAVLVGLQHPDSGTGTANTMSIAQLTTQVNAQAAQIAQLQAEVAALQGQSSAVTFDGTGLIGLAGGQQATPDTVFAFLKATVPFSISGNPPTPTDVVIPLYTPGF